MSEQAHVLVVEDHETVASAMCILFENAGRRVSTAATISEALDVAQRDPARLVLLDLKLPDGDGLTLVAPLLAAGCGTVVALTGRDEPETHARCLAAGCTEVLQKATPIRELIARTAVWLDNP